jgi:hypothetical protein
MKIVGIDPGLTGAIACIRYLDLALTESRVDAVHDMPVTSALDGRPMPDAVAVYDILRAMAPDLILLEHVEARPGRGSSSSFRFAQGFGAILAAAQLSVDGQRVHLVRPRIWKGALGLDSEKAKSLSLARSEFPDAATLLKRQRDDGRAEALLLTTYHRKVLVPSGEMEVV